MTSENARHAPSAVARLLLLLAEIGKWETGIGRRKGQFQDGVVLLESQGADAQTRHNNAKEVKVRNEGRCSRGTGSPRGILYQRDRHSAVDSVSASWAQRFSSDSCASATMLSSLSHTHSIPSRALLERSSYLECVMATLGVGDGDQGIRGMAVWWTSGVRSTEEVQTWPASDGTSSRRRGPGMKSNETMGWESDYCWGRRAVQM